MGIGRLNLYTVAVITQLRGKARLYSRSVSPGRVYCPRHSVRCAKELPRSTPLRRHLFEQLELFAVARCNPAADGAKEQVARCAHLSLRLHALQRAHVI